MAARNGFEGVASELAIGAFWGFRIRTTHARRLEMQARIRGFLASVGSVELPEKIDIPWNLVWNVRRRRECWATSGVGSDSAGCIRSVQLNEETTPTRTLGPLFGMLCALIR